MQEILTFWTKFAQNEYFPSKAEKVNSTIEFIIFELESLYQISSKL